MSATQGTAAQENRGASSRRLASYIRVGRKSGAAKQRLQLCRLQRQRGSPSYGAGALPGWRVRLRLERGTPDGGRPQCAGSVERGARYLLLRDPISVIEHGNKPGAFVAIDVTANVIGRSSRVPGPRRARAGQGAGNDLRGTVGAARLPSIMASQLHGARTAQSGRIVPVEIRGHVGATGDKKG